MKNTYDIFKGKKDKSGKIIKIRSVGFANALKKETNSSLHLKDLESRVYLLVPEKDPFENHDFFIVFQKESFKNKISNDQLLEIVGTGTLLTGINSGLIKLEWDLWGNDDIYLSLTNDWEWLETKKLAA